MGRVLVLVGHEPNADPRIGWLATSLAREHKVYEVAAITGLPESRREWLPPRRFCIRTACTASDPDCALSLNLGRRGWLAFESLTELRRLIDEPVAGIERFEELHRFRWYARHFADLNFSLVMAAQRAGVDYDAIVAVDMATLPVGLMLGDHYNAPVLYDAHEFWPHSAVEFSKAATVFWLDFEAPLARAADIRVTVSPHLATEMMRQYDCDWLSVPNCVPLADAAVAFVHTSDAMQRFLFLGGFWAGRGIETLIDAWRHTDARARLLLQGLENQYKNEYRTSAGERVEFPPPVDVSQLIEAAALADVGVIPYPPSCLNNRYCCPNKLSQYMAAGLPILANRTEYVAAVIDQNNLGRVVDFSDRRQLCEAVQWFVDNPRAAADCGRRARHYFERVFNWDLVSAPMFARLSQMMTASADAAA